MAATKAPDKILPGPELDALTAQKVFGWRNVHKHDAALIGKKQDKLGRWRTTKVPSYSTDPVHAYAIEQRMEHLGRWQKYMKELSKIAAGRKIPAGWAPPDQRCRAAIKAVRKLNAVKPR